MSNNKKSILAHQIRRWTKIHILVVKQISVSAKLDNIEKNHNCNNNYNHTPWLQNFVIDMYQNISISCEKILTTKLHLRTI